MSLVYFISQFEFLEIKQQQLFKAHINCKSLIIQSNPFICLMKEIQDILFFPLN